MARLPGGLMPAIIFAASFILVAALAAGPHNTRPHDTRPHDTGTQTQTPVTFVAGQGLGNPASSSR